MQLPQPFEQLAVEFGELSARADIRCFLPAPALLAAKDILWIRIGRRDAFVCIRCLTSQTRIRERAVPKLLRQKPGHRRVYGSKKSEELPKVAMPKRVLILGGNQKPKASSLLVPEPRKFRPFVTSAAKDE